MSKVEVVGLTIEVGELKGTISVEDARKLHALLDEMFGKKVVINPAPIFIEKERHPDWPRYTPTWCDDAPTSAPYPPFPKITCMVKPGQEQ